MSFERDWALLRAAIPYLRDYLLSNELYWSLDLPARSTDSAVLPRLTIGNLALSQARLAALPLEPAQQDRRADLVQRIGQVRGEWRTNWGRKAEKEFPSRLNLWQKYLRELSGDPPGHAAYFTSEVRQRAILQLLFAEMNGSPASKDMGMLDNLDGALRQLAQPGPFVWEPEIQSGFPKESFWFLSISVS